MSYERMGYRIDDQGEHGFLVSGTTYPIDHHLPPTSFDFTLTDDEAEELADWLLGRLARRKEIAP